MSRRPAPVAPLRSDILLPRFQNALEAESLPQALRTLVARDGDFRHEDGGNRFCLEHPHTPIQIHGGGRGDAMIVWQLAQAFAELASEQAVPELGKVVVAVGAMRPAYHPEPGDVNVYWWWSFGEHDDAPEAFLEDYLDRVTVEPDLIACLSERCRKQADELGFDTVHLPLASQAYRPLGLDRSGCGYAGTLSHKATDKEQAILGPVRDREDFAWVTGLVTPEQLNLWYNTLAFTLGLTKEGQREWGMVNNRVFEALASGTPFILERHPTVEDVLGFPYPYQAASQDEVREHVDRFTNAPDEVADEFATFSRQIREQHTYTDRLTRLLEALT